MPRTRPNIADLRAMKRKTATSALEIIAAVREYEQAGAVGAEIGVVPVKFAKAMSEHTSLFMLSMGARTGCDAQYLLPEDILGLNRSRISRHSRVIATSLLNTTDCSRNESLPDRGPPGGWKVSYSEDGHVVHADPAELDILLEAPI